MEATVDRAVDELAATVVDAIVYADMVTTFIMEPGWNEAKTAAIAARTGVPCVSAWTALRDALAALGVRRFALGTPYPAAIHALCRPFFAARGLAITGDATLDILKMTDVPKVTPERVAALVDGLDRSGAEAVVLLATDLPTFGSIAALEARTGLPVLSSNQTILWRSLRVVGYDGPIDGLGRLFAMKAPA
jgi:maleate cis-trans isomerase